MSDNLLFAAGLRVTVLVFSLIPAFANADVIGRVIAISDGDTLTVLDSQKVQHKVRLSGCVFR